MIRSNRITHAAALAWILGVAASWLPAPAMAQTNVSIWLLWTAGGDDGDMGRASYYELKYSTTQPAASDSASIATWWLNATSASGLPAPPNSGSPDSTLVTGLTPATRYYFVIRSVDDGGNRSPFSNIAEGTSCSPPTSPPDLFPAVADTGRVDLSWTGSDALATMIHIYRGTGTTGSLTLLATLSNPAATSYTDFAVSAGTTYRYRVAWANTCADGPPSVTRSATLPGTPPPPAAETEAPKLHAYPNPSSGSAPVQFVIHVPGSASQGVLIRLYDLSGRWVATVADGSYGPGDHTVSWNRLSRTGGAVSPGYYEAIGTVGGTRVRDRIFLKP